MHILYIHIIKGYMKEKDKVSMIKPQLGKLESPATFPGAGLLFFFYLSVALGIS